MYADYSESTLKRFEPTAANSAGNTESRWSRKNHTVEAKSDNADNGLKAALVTEKTEENPSSSETRPKEGATLSLLLFYLETRPKEGVELPPVNSIS